MKRLFLVLFAISSLTAQQSGIEQSLDLTTLSTGEHLLHWYGKSGRSYFVQVSDSNDSLTNWRWGPIIEAGNDEVISHEVGSIGDKGFWRLKYTDQVPGPGENLDTADFDSDGLSNLTEISYQPPLTPTDPLNPDSDGDGMTDGFERTYGFDPNNSDEDSDGVSDGSGDSDEDGLSNVDEALSDTDPLNPNSDGDSLLDGEDADPKEILVAWAKAAECSYMLIDVDAPAGSWPQDINDKGDVLFNDGISSDGNWHPRQIPLGSGTDPDDTSYDIAYQSWNHFNNDKQLLGSSELTFTEGQGAGGGFSSPVFMPEGHSSPSLVLDTADLWNPYPRAFETLGVSTNGQMVVRIEMVADTYKHIDRYSAAGAIIGQMNGSDGFHPSGGFYGHGAITPTGWVASNQTREATESQPAANKVGLWSPNNNLVPLPPEAQGWGYPVCVTDLPNNVVGMTVGNWNGSNRTGRVFLPDANGDYQYVASLSSCKIDRFAGDGTAITFDNKLWRNGKLIPLRDLCLRYGELLDAGWTFEPVKANKNGVYLIHASGPNGQQVPMRAIPVNLSITNSDSPYATQFLPEDKEESVGAFTVANLNDQDGDGVIDNLDSSVKSVGGIGEDEDDLMFMKVEGPFDGQMKVAVFGGGVHFWERPTKETEYPMQEGEIAINGSDLPKTLYIEVNARSQTLRDIEFKLSHIAPDGTVYNDLDRVKATAVWAEQKSIKNTSGAGLWTTTHDPVFKDTFTNHLGDWGINFNAVNDPSQSFHYSIGIEFEVGPPGIAQEPGVKFDIARDRAFRDWWITKNPASIDPAYQVDDDKFDLADTADDDGGLIDIDEDVIGTGDRIYVLDGPGNPLSAKLADEIVSRNNFLEWVRVSFNGIRPRGNNHSGSRCSGKFPWHA